MRAVNLIPAEQRTSQRGLGVKLATPTYGLFGLLAAALVMVTLYVLASNTVSDRQAQLASTQSALTRLQSEAAQLQSYTKFATLATTRLQTVRGIAATRFDWNLALQNLARVVPSTTSLQSLTGSVVPGASAGGGAGAAGASGLRADLQGPAFTVTGCTGSHVAVAQLISRLRAMPGVRRVALGSSQKSAASGGGQGSGGCKANAATFSLVIFYQPVTGAGANGAISVSGASSTTTAGGSL